MEDVVVDRDREASGVSRLSGRRLEYFPDYDMKLLFIVLFIICCRPRPPERKEKKEKKDLRGVRKRRWKWNHRRPSGKTAVQGIGEEKPWKTKCIGNGHR